MPTKETEAPISDAKAAMVEYVKLDDTLQNLRAQSRKDAARHNRLKKYLITYCEENNITELDCGGRVFEFKMTPRTKTTTAEDVLTLVEERLQEFDGVKDISETFVDDIVSTLENDKEVNYTKRLILRKK